MAFLPGVLHVNRPLTDLVTSFDPSEQGYLRSTYMPRKPVSKKSDQIRQVSKGELLRLQNPKVSPNGKVNEVQFAMDTTQTYQAITYAFQAVMDAEERAMADSEVAYDMRMLQSAMLKMNTAMEYLCIKDTLRAQSASATLSGATLWDNVTSSSSDPIGDMLTGVSQIKDNIGKDGNIHVSMHLYVWNAIKQHPNVLNRVTFTGAPGALLTKDILCDLLDIPRGNLHVTTAHYNSAIEGEADSFKAFIGSDVLIGHTEDPSLSDFGLGHEFSFSGYSGDDPYTVLTFPDNNRSAWGSDITRVIASVDYKILNTAAFYRIATTVNTANAAYNGRLD